MRGAGFVVVQLVCATLVECMPKAPAPPEREVRVVGKHWVNTSTGRPVVLRGDAVVVKGPPWFPSVSGTERCNGTSSCKTFNAADAAHLRAQGKNFIRLGVAWPGAQPTDTDTLDPTFVSDLRAILDVCRDARIFVVLDMHGDMVGTANCGWGVPMWLSEQAAAHMIGKPLKTELLFRLLAASSEKFEGDFKLGPTSCDANESLWGLHAGEPLYNQLNPCCAELNSGGNNNALGFTSLAQATMDYLLKDGPGRRKFVRYWGLLAEAVADCPAVIGMELMNEPISIRRWDMFETWQAASDAITRAIPNMSVGVMDFGSGAMLPAWFAKIGGSAVIPSHTVKWLKSADNLFYAWHYYGRPKDPRDAIKNVLALQDDWNVAAMLTETQTLAAIQLAEAAGMPWAHWVYSHYCDTAPQFGGHRPPDSFGACILGW